MAKQLMKRRQFFAAAFAGTAGLVLPYEPERIYSFPSPPRRGAVLVLTPEMLIECKNLMEGSLRIAEQMNVDDSPRAIRSFFDLLVTSRALDALSMDRAFDLLSTSTLDAKQIERGKLVWA